ncbi:DEAD/DEAH box helicase [Xylocopilactobacillus apicola]|uniref:ATP-dependent RNA helicase CshA n=1 Tax=Xylocopilactobacillus apicola TaxID=2932184 RepID=A0AAU9D7N0_9LACO|nr:DEAD/DEAH box helicase [Xylocopilactobacillus apicola]BDR58325.1 DEAD-box ATP-dependent RNA helicase CshA [Xylocopilactobacillus apicola]
MKFNELDLQPELLTAINDAGYVEMTPIQEQAMPVALANKDVMGQAQTGTGKTAAFGIPAIQQANHNDHFVSTLIMSPTRELAIQTRDEIAKLGHDKKIRVMVVYGGSDIGRQIRDLKNPPQILVGTPGRLQDHMNRKTVDFSHLKTLVLDEADEMLDMGFLEDISKIIRSLPKERQTLLFSATLPQDIVQIGTAFMNNPVTVKVKSKELTADLIDQYYVKARDNEKFDFMTRLMDVQRPELALVFGRTKRRVDELTRGLKIRGFKAEGIHGDLTQQKRMNVLRMFKNSEIQILVATDVAARGLDIRGVTHVYNYDIPQDPDSYVHRIGRTGRAGRAGMSITFVNPREMDYLRGIEKLTKVKMMPLMPPTAEKVQKELLDHAVSVIEDKSSSIHVNNYQKYAEKLVEEVDPMILASLLLQSYTKSSSKNRPVSISVERPLPSKKKSSGKGYQKYNHGSSRRYNSKKPYHHDRDQKKYGQRDHKRSSSNQAKTPKKVNRNFVIRTKA